MRRPAAGRVRRRRPAGSLAENTLLRAAKISVTSPAMENDSPLRPIADAPKDGTVIYTVVAVKWIPYKPTSQQAKRGIKGRWMESNGYGGWRPCLNGEPALWMPVNG